MKIDGTEKDINVDTGSTYTITPTDNEVKRDNIFLPITKNYEGVMKYEAKIVENITVKAENRGGKNRSTKIITKQEGITLLLGMD